MKLDVFFNHTQQSIDKYAVLSSASKSEKHRSLRWPVHVEQKTYVGNQPHD